MIQAHPFPIFEAATLQQCIATLRRAPEAGDVELPAAVRKHVLAPLCEAAETTGAEKLATGRRRNDTVHAIAVGTQLFPILVYSSGRTTEIAVFPPVARDRCSAEVLRTAANAFSDLGSQQHASFQQEAQRATAVTKWLEVFHGANLPNALVVHTKDDDTTLVYDKQPIDDGAFAKEVRSLVGLLLRTAQAPQAVAQTSTWGSLFGFGSDSNKPQQLSAELRGLVNPRVKVSEAAGPPSGLADDLCFAGVWRDRIVALTSQRTAGGRTRLWIEDSIDGTACFREIPTPKDLPPHGVSMALIDDEVHLYGGAHTDGSTTAASWTYALQTAAHSGFAGGYWRAGTPMSKEIAWPVVVTVGRDVYVSDGVQELTADAKGDKFRMPLLARGLRRLQNLRWLDRSSPPADTTGASVASDRRVFVVGPGNLRDGKLYMCDTAQDSTWYALPPLPKAVGLGQVILADDKITYLGGFDSDGKPSKDLYQLDLNSLSGRWQHVGTSSYLAGRARVVRRNGYLVSIMMTPTASRVYQLAA